MATSLDHITKIQNHSTSYGWFKTAYYTRESIRGGEQGNTPPYRLIEFDRPLFKI